MEETVWINESPETGYVFQLDNSSAPPHTFRVVSRGTTVRRSCNACSAQKIRCGAERPTCKRCTAKGLPCTYMPSKRRGPRNRSGKNDRTTLCRETEDDILNKDDGHSDAVDNAHPDIENNETPPLDQHWTSSALLQNDGDWDFTFNEHWSHQHVCPEFDASEAPAEIRSKSTEPASMSAPGTHGLGYNAIPGPRSRTSPQHLSDTLARSIEEPEKSKCNSNHAMVRAPLRKEGRETLALRLLSGWLTKLSCCNSTNVDDKGVHPQLLDPDGRIAHIQQALRQIEAFLDLPGSLGSDFWDFSYLIIKQALASYDSMLQSDCSSSYYIQQDPAAEQRLSNKRAWFPSGSRPLDPKAQRLLGAYLVLMDTKNLVQPLLERLEGHRDTLAERSSGSSIDSGPSWEDLRLMTLQYQHRSVEKECNRLAEAAQSVGKSLFSEQWTLKSQSKGSV